MLSCKSLAVNESYCVDYKKQHFGFDYLYHILVYIFAFFDFNINIGNFGIKVFYFFSLPIIIIEFVNLFKQKLQKIDFLVFLWILSSFFAVGHILSWSDTITCVLGESVLFLLYKDIQHFLFKYSISPYKVTAFIGKMICLFCFYAILQFLLYALFRIDIGVSHVSVLGFPRPRSVFAEPDWLGMYSMVGFLICLYFFAISKQKNGLIGLVICGISMLLSFARASWVGFFIGFIILFCYLPGIARKRVLHMFALFFVVGLLALVLFGFIETDFIESLLIRLNPTKWMTNDYGAAGSRTASIDIMWYFIKLHPFTGNGSGSMNYVSSNLDLTTSLGYNFQINAGRGNANLVLATWFDVGLFGALFFFLFIYFLFKKCHQFLKQRKRKSVDIVCVLISIFWALLVDFEFNNGIRFSTVWLFFGIINYSCSKKQLIQKR